MPGMLNEDERRQGLAGLPEWRETAGGGAIGRTFRFADFGEAFAFMTRVALEAEKLDHHPDWSNSYNVVEIKLTTHDQGGVTAGDLELARRIDAVSG